MFRLIRPEQYIKNLFIFGPLFFAGGFTHIAKFLNTLTAFAGFSLLASAIYVFNDYWDRGEDRLHPIKRSRPIASGAITQLQAIWIVAVLSIVGFSIMASLSLEVLMIISIYVVLNFAYCLYLKHVAILDVTIISIGFVLRLFVGSTVASVDLSNWIVVMTFLLALFIALAKRRDDILIFMDTGKKMRKVIDGYNMQFLDTAMAIMASVVIVAYVIYTTSTEVIENLNSRHLYFTALFVILGIMRFLKISFVDRNSGSPTTIVLKDHFMQAILLGWILTFSWILYL